MSVRAALSRVVSLVRRRQRDLDLDDEIRVHLELLAAEYERRGMTSDAARLAARRAFGGVQQMKETFRDSHGLRWLEDARRDVRHALRTLRRSPVFTGAAVLTMAVGVTAVIVIFAVLNAFMLRPMPVERPEELVSVSTAPDRHVSTPHGISFPDLQDYRQERTTFVDLAGYNVEVAGLNADNATDRITMYSVTDNYFTLLGVRPAIGRLIQPNEGRARGDAPVIVLTHEYWQARFGGDPSIVGRSVRLNGRPFTVIGVTPPPFDGAHSLLRPSAYVPLWMRGELVESTASRSILEARDRHQLWVLGRLRPGVSLEQARAAMEVKAATLAREYPVSNGGVSVVVLPETHSRPIPPIGPFFRVAATVFAGLAALLLLITSANVTNLLMARAVSREREVVLRAALGAGRSRLVRQLLTESVLLAVLAGVVAVPVAARALDVMTQGMAATTSLATIRADLSLDSRVLVVAFLLMAVAGVVSGLAPAIVATRTDLTAAVKAGGRGAAGEPRAFIRNALVVVQVALSLMLLVSGGLFLRSLDRARQIELGFEPDGLVLASAIPAENGYDRAQRLNLYSRARDRIRALPGVEQAAWIQWAPLATVSEGGPVWIDGQPPRTGEQAFSAMWASVDADYFATTRISLVDGRSFDGRDIVDIRTMGEHLVREGGGFLAFELGAMFTGIFGIAGVLLAGIGLYGMIAGGVAQRTQEFGVRIALGAKRRSILRDVLGRAVRLASIGIAGGALLAAFAARGLRTLLLDVSPFDPVTYLVVSLLLVGVCLLAAFIPARRATRVDPIVALRAE
jgi:predicted permease